MEINGVLKGGLLEDSATALKPNEIGAITTGDAFQSDVEPSAGNVRPMYVGSGAGKSRVVYSNEVSPIASRLSSAEYDIVQLQLYAGTNIKAKADHSFLEQNNYDTLYANVTTTPTMIGTAINGGFDVSVSAFPSNSVFGFGNFFGYAPAIPATGINTTVLEVGAVYDILATVGVSLVQATALISSFSTSDFAYTLEEPAGPGNFAFVETKTEFSQPLMMAVAGDLWASAVQGKELKCFRYNNNQITRSIFAESVSLGTVTKTAGGITYSLSNGSSGPNLYITPPLFSFAQAGPIRSETRAVISRPEIIYRLFKR